MEQMEDHPASSSSAASNAPVGVSVPLRNWENANQVEADAIYEFNEKEQTDIRNAKPWEKDQHFFKEVKMSAVALLKMVMHAKRGGNLEVMGLMQGRIEGNAFVVMDSFALPVEGTETRVNAQAQAYEYMTVYSDLCESLGKKEKVVGWYHSHPGYGCWLSGIDVATQSLNQQYQEPWVAIVIDPLRTMSAGKVDIGAFRTYPKGYNPPEAEGPSEYQTIPLNKVEDFGVHCKQYYSLDVSFFKSQLDSHVLNALWDTYWLNTLSSSPLITNAAYINNQMGDLAGKIKQIEKKWGRSGFAEISEQLDKAVRDAKTIGNELVSSSITQQMKNVLFNHRCCHSENPPPMEINED